ncbi:YoaK family protein [Daejeonella oryzae]|uniref:YoaK family protein n=1 Tax=Daejeonella oryzae TaxID=1122943 RepID=UPI0003F5D08A|nr:YoaK family protein [Daejeonella oryzae]
MLSFIAGIVNVTGVLAVNTLTTNVTGHFGYFAEELVNKNYETALIFLIFILFFLLGAFVSNFLIEIVSRSKPQISHSGPMMIEILILIFLGLFGYQSSFSTFEGQIIACALLFSMGIQNSLVTQVSQATVRTTHLTGLFTDLGIELSQLFFYRKLAEIKKLKRSIYLRLIIIFFFFTGCVLGGFMFKAIGLKTLWFASFFLIIALIYDNLRYRFYLFKRKLMSRS